MTCINVNIFPVLSEQESDVVFEETATVMSTPPRPAVPPPAYVRPTNYQDLIVGNQKRQPTPSTQKSPRKQSSFSPYRRQTSPAASKGSPSAEAIRDRYVQERAKAKVQSKNLVAKFKNNGTGTGASEVAGASSSAKSKEGDATINCTLKQAEKAKTETENGTIGLTTSTPSTSISTTTALDDFIVRTPSRIPRAISPRHRSMSSNMNVKRQTIPCSEKLKHLTANQLLRRMNKSLLGTSRPPVLSRTIVQKGLSATIHLVTRKPVAGTSSDLATATSTSTPRTTSALSPATNSTASSTPTTTPVSTTTTKSSINATSDQYTLPAATASSPATTDMITTTATTTKMSPRAAPVAKSERVIRSVLSDKFRRVTRSTTAAASYML
ncbi:MAG: hypothetical protein J3R72DRAFT_444291 [Linnemannia gamsii]|nr:MAG: hypothetical protein J3R72DRAFT_444291 [Linnemannia gamsii]